MVVDQWRRVFLICLALISLLFGCSVQQQFLVSRQDRLALLQLRSSLGLRAREWPIKTDPCTSWAGIECTNGRVTAINISGFRRTRRGNANPQFSIDAIQNLTLLSSFNASNFELPGSIPEWLGLRVFALQVLDLSSCSINGAIPFTLGNLTSLVELHLSDNNLTGIIPSSLGQLIGLSVLDLSHNSLVGSIPEGFTSLGNLTLLDISSNNLAGEIPPSIGTLSRLQLLNLSRNSLSSSIPAQLGNLSSLVDLDLGINSLEGSVPQELMQLINLRRLAINNNLLSSSLPSNLFTPLTQLRFVVLSHNRFSGDFPNELWSMPSLQFFDASVNNFTGILPNVGSSVNNVSNLVFNISRNLFYGNLTPVIQGFGFVDLSENYFEGPVPSYASGNTFLGGNCLRNSANQRRQNECASFYTERNLVFDNFGEPNSTRPPGRNTNNSNRRLIIILASIFGAIGVVAFLIIIIGMFIICKRKQRGTPNQRSTGVGPIPQGETPPPHGGASLNFSSLGDKFSYNQIVQATGEFSDANLIKEGHSGDLFSGTFEGGIHVVIKKIDLSSSVKKEAYMSELDLFSKHSHPRLVPLLGHCLENETEKFLVYKYMRNADLYSSLFKKTNSGEDSLKSLDWITRLKIAIGAAEALSYLHHDCTPPLVHRDIQASSILLDDKYEVRLGSLSEVCSQGSDIYQSRMTRLLRLPQTSDQGASGKTNATCAYDVYCFGKVLLELVTGKLGVSSSNDAATKDWLETTLRNISIYDKELVTNILDPSLIIDEDLLEEVWAMAIVARSCLNPKPTRRPLMRYILKALENPLKVVREEHTSSARLRTTSSRGSWNAALFGSWRQSSSDVAAVPMAQSHRVEASGSFKQSGTSGSQNDDGNGQTSSSRQHSKEIVPETKED